jgi:hypothetical protein
MTVMRASQQSFALFPVCPSQEAASATLLPLSVAELSAANALTPVSPKSDKRDSSTLKEKACSLLRV